MTPEQIRVVRECAKIASKAICHKSEIDGKTYYDGECRVCLKANDILCDIRARFPDAFEEDDDDR